MAKHEFKNAKNERPEHWGMVSSAHLVPLFDKNSNETHTFTKDVYDRRQKEVDEFAAKANFVKVYSGNVVTFEKKSRAP